MKQKFIISESQFERLQKTIIEQGLYGSTEDVVDYDLPEYYSDILILKKPENFEDVKNSIKEIHKRLIRIEKGLEDGGSHNKPYSTDTKYSAKNKRFKAIEKHQKDEDVKDEELEQEIERIRQYFINRMPEVDSKDL